MDKYPVVYCAALINVRFGRSCGHLSMIKGNLMDYFTLANIHDVKIVAGNIDNTKPFDELVEELFRNALNLKVVK
jgi:hypothetical protein